MKRIILTQAFNSTHPDSLSNQINDFLRENNIQKIIDIKYSSFKRDDNTNDYSALLVYIGMSEEQISKKQKHTHAISKINKKQVRRTITSK